MLSLLTASLLLCAQESLSLYAHVKVVGLQNASAPEIFEESLIFSSDLKARFVGVAFEHEHYAIIHPMRRNQHGIFFLVYPIPVQASEPEKMEKTDKRALKDDTLRYRLIADGSWSFDPRNPERYVDPESGMTVSLLKIPHISDDSPGAYPILEANGRTAHFRYRGEPGLVITVAGSFNDWDPFMYEMAETEPGLYELELELPSGKQRYAFIDRGKKVADSLNLDSAYTPEGTRVSVLQVP